jgi:hypothetical protein
VDDLQGFVERDRAHGCLLVGRTSHVNLKFAA